MANKKTSSPLLTALLCLFTVHAAAATHRAMDLTELVGKADCILVGTVVEQTSAWNAEHTRIYTRTTIEVDEYLKGDEGRTIVIETLGGVAEGIRLYVPGMPAFRLQEKNLIFVQTGARTRTHRVMGWAQGRFRIHKDPKTGRERLLRPMVGVSLLNQLDPKLKSVRYLNEMKEAVRQIKAREP